MAGESQRERSLCVGDSRMSKRDLFVVVADLDAENAISMLLRDRQSALDIHLDFNPDRPPVGDLLRYAGRDSGCYKDAVDVLRTPQSTHRHALLIFDRDGCGANATQREDIECEVEGKLRRSGWGQDAVSVIVIEPELEAWVWATSPRVADVLGWQYERDGLRPFLTSRNLWDDKCPKPSDPKEAMRQSLRKKNKPLGARLFAELASRVGLRHCEDSAFQKFRQTLTQWFGVASHDRRPGTDFR